MKSRWKFLLRFALLLVVFELPLLTRPVDQYVARPVSAGIAATSGALLRVIGERVVVTGSVITAPRFAVDLQNRCNGLETLLLLPAAGLGFPAHAPPRVLA